jgi:Ca-activated chloride channel family protein
MSDYYTVLGIPRSATAELIRRAYHQAARHLHPDVNPEFGANEDFLRLQDAYEVLCDPKKRQDYDATLPPELTLCLTTSYSRTTLPPLRERQILYALIQLSVPAGMERPPAPPMNTCLVLDCSTSMQGKRLDMLKKASIELIRQLRKKDALSIIAFSDRAETLYSSRTQSDLSAVETEIQLLQARGATEIFRGLEAGLCEVRCNLSKDSVNHLLLITDGHTYGDEPACLELAAAAAAQGIGISSLGIGHEWNDVFLEKLASLTGGSAAYLSRLDDLQGYLQQKLNALGNLFAERISLEGALEPGVELQYAFRLSPDAAPVEPALPLQAGPVTWEAPLVVLCEFVIPGFPGENAAPPAGLRDGVFPFLEGALTYQPISQRKHAYSLPLRLELPVSADSREETPPPDLMQALSRLTLYRMQEKARDELAVGEIEKGTRRLQQLATHLFSKGERDLARTVLEEASQVERGRSLSQEGQKKIKYGTRALLPLPNAPPGGARHSAGLWEGRRGLEDAE